MKTFFFVLKQYREMVYFILLLNIRNSVEIIPEYESI